MIYLQRHVLGSISAPPARIHQIAAWTPLVAPTRSTGRVEVSNSPLQRVQSIGGTTEPQQLTIFAFLSYILDDAFYLRRRSTHAEASVPVPMITWLSDTAEQRIESLRTDQRLPPRHFQLTGASSLRVPAVASSTAPSTPVPGPRPRPRPGFDRCRRRGGASSASPAVADYQA